MISWQKTEKSNFDDELTSIKERHPDGMITEAKLLNIHMVVSRELARVNDFLTSEIFWNIYFSATGRKIIKMFVKI